MVLNRVRVLAAVVACSLLAPPALAGPAGAPTTSTVSAGPASLVPVRHRAMAAEPKAGAAEHEQSSILITTRTPQDASLAAAAIGAVVGGRADEIGVAELRLPPGLGVFEAAAAVRSVDGVLEAEPNWRRRAMLQPNDPWYNGDPPGINNGKQWAPQAIGAPQAWDTTTGSSNVTIAVLDTGVNAASANVTGRLINGPDYVDGDDNPSDSHGHGTDVAALAAATGNDNTGIAGIDWNAKILAIRVLDDEAGGSDFDIARGVVHAAERGARVIVLSLGAPVFSVILGRAVAHAQARGSVVVAAVGNDGLPLPMFPAAYPGVLATGTVDRNGELAWFSSYGEAVDLTAPGVDLLAPGPAPHLVSGTSFSAAIVAGAASLVAAANPSFTGAQVADRLVSTADDLGKAGTDSRFGAGRVNVHRAVGGSPSQPARPSGDSFEPNDARGDAKPISLNADVKPTFVPAGDEDWFSVQAPGGLLKVELTAPATSGTAKVDGALHLYNSFGDPIAAVDRVGVAEKETITVNIPGGTVLVRVLNLFGNGSPNAYTLRAGTGSQQDTPPDDLQPDTRIADVQRVGDGSTMRVRLAGFDNLSAVRFRYDVRPPEEFAALTPRFEVTGDTFERTMPDGVYIVAAWAIDASGLQDLFPTFALVPVARNRPQGDPLASLFAYDPAFRGGVYLASGDVDGNGFDDIITGAGPGGGPHIRVVRASGEQVASFFAFDPGFRGGVRVAAADVDGDGLEEVVTAAGPGGGPHVRVWRIRTGAAFLQSEWFAFDPSFLGGVYVAGGDVDGDNKDDVVAAAGAGGGPHVRVFRQGGVEIGSFFAFGPGFSGGVRVATGDLDAGGKDAVIAAAGPGGGPHVRALRRSASGTFDEVASFFAYDGFSGGVYVGAGDLDGDLRSEIVTGAGPGGGPHVKVFTGAGGFRFGLFAYAAAFGGGVRVAIGDVNRDFEADIVTAAGPGGGPHIRAFE